MILYFISHSDTVVCTLWKANKFVVARKLKSYLPPQLESSAVRL